MTGRPKNALIFDVQRFSVHDGPGIRTVVFFKGCSLGCHWCQNPESIDPRPEMAFYAARCIGCGRCAEVCPRGAIAPDGDHRVVWDRCDACGRCADECPADALRLVGRSVTAEELLEECLADREFFEVSGGGITLSGGEPILQADFLLDFLPRLKNQGVSRLIETAGHYPFSRLKPLLPFIDHVYYDFKLADDRGYRDLAGGDRKLVLENLNRLIAQNVPVTVRIPVIPGVNTGTESVEAVGRALSDAGVSRIHLLKYNHLWEAKIPRLGSGRRGLGVSDDGLDYNGLLQRFDSAGLEAILSG